MVEQTRHRTTTLTAKLEELMRIWLQLSPVERKIGLIAARHMAIRKHGHPYEIPNPH